MVMAQPMLRFTSESGQSFTAESDSPGFVYLTRDPKKGVAAVDPPVIDSVICDNRPGDLLVLYGDRLAHAGLLCEIDQQGTKLILHREPTTGFSKCFTARLPFNICAGPAALRVLTSEGRVVSNQVELSILSPTDLPALPCTPLPLALEQPSSSRPSEELMTVEEMNRGKMKVSRQAKREARRPQPYPPTVRKEKEAVDGDLLDKLVARSTPEEMTMFSHVTLSRQGSEDLCRVLGSPSHFSLILQSPSHQPLITLQSPSHPGSCGNRSLSRTISEEFSAFLNNPVDIPLGILASPVQSV